MATRESNNRNNKPSKQTRDHYNLARLLISGFLMILGILITGSLLLNRTDFMDEVNAFAAIFAGWIGAIMGYYFGYKPAQRAIDETNEVKDEKRDLEIKLSDTQMKEALTAKDLMTSKVIGVDKADSLDKVMDRMKELGVKHIPVFDDDICKGIISAADILQIMNADPRDYFDDFNSTSRDFDFRNMPIYNMLPSSEKHISVPIDKSISEIKKLFIKNNLTALQVKEEDKFLGIITRGDLLEKV